MIEKLLKNAKQALRTAQIDLDAGDTNGSVNRSYYAAYYAAWAMFAAAGVEKPKTHSGFISEFSRRFVKNGLIEAVHGSSLSKLENLRCFADYTLEDIPMEKANTGLRTAEEFVQAVASYLASSKGGE